MVKPGDGITGFGQSEGRFEFPYPGLDRLASAHAYESQEVQQCSNSEDVLFLIF